MGDLKSTIPSSLQTLNFMCAPNKLEVRHLYDTPLLGLKDYASQIEEEERTSDDELKLYNNENDNNNNTYNGLPLLEKWLGITTNSISSMIHNANIKSTNMATILRLRDEDRVIHVYNLDPNGKELLMACQKNQIDNLNINFSQLRCIYGDCSLCHTS